MAECDPREISFFHHDRAFRFHDPPTPLPHRWIKAKRSTPAIVLSHVHPGVAILLAAVCGGLITVLVGIARMFRLRRAAKKNLKALTSGR